jgi:HK97 family phage major capsid protein/HK97 family phage prohead protease
MQTAPAIKPDTTQARIQSGVLYRAATFGTIDEEKRTTELAFSSEAPVDRFFGMEILDHGLGSVVMDFLQSGRAPLLADHDTGIQIGVIERAEIGKDRVGRAVVRFGKGETADAYFQDVKDGIRANISVGYRIHQMILEETGDGGDVYRATKWEPLEISLVSIPADQSVGIGRSGGEARDITIIQTKQLNQPLERKTMTTPENPAANVQTAPAIITVDANAERAAIREKETARIREINALGTRHNLTDKAAEFIGTGKTADEFRALVLDSIGVTPPVQTANSGAIGLSDKEARDFSFLKVLRAMSDPTNQKLWEAAAFEREVSQATVDQFKHRKFRGNFAVPSDVLLVQRSAGMQKRDLNVANNAQGGYMVGTEIRPESFIELLRNRMMVRQLGARVLSGLEGNITIPKQTGAGTAYWVNEGGDVTESTQAIGQVAMSPKTVGGYTEFTRRMLLQSSPDVENFVRDDLAQILAIGIDRAALRGSGTGGEPLGILNTTGIGSVTITTGTFTFAKLVDLETEVAIDNADLGSLAYLASATDRGIMKKTEKSSSTGQYIWNNMAGMPGVGEVNGYPAYASNQLAADSVIFGNWAELIIGEWGVLDLNVNPYKKDQSGGVCVTALQDVDIAVRHPESFARTTV